MATAVKVVADHESTGFINLCRKRSALKLRTSKRLCQAVTTPRRYRMAGLRVGHQGKAGTENGPTIRVGEGDESPTSNRLLFMMSTAGQAGNNQVGTPTVWASSVWYLPARGGKTKSDLLRSNGKVALQSIYRIDRRRHRTNSLNVCL